MVYQEVGYNEPCLERKSTRKEANSIDRKEKENASEEDSVRSQKLRRSEKEQEEKELGKVDDRPTPVTESHNSEDDSDELPDPAVKEPAITTFSPFQDHPHPPIGNILEKAFSNNFEK